MPQKLKLMNFNLMSYSCKYFVIYKKSNQSSVIFMKIKEKLMQTESKRLLSNFISLFTLQGLNYILPLITLPYLVRVLGVEIFGLLAFATATVTYFNILTDYGFNLTATKKIALYRENKDKVVEIFSAVMSVKILLMIVSFLLLTLLVFSVAKFTSHWELYLLSFGAVIGQVFFPVWFFQGMEKMKYITYLNILAKVIFTVAIFFFVQSKEDAYVVPLLTSLGALISGFFSLIIIKKQFKVSFKFQKLSTLNFYRKEAHHIFISNIAISLYTVSTVFILGLLTNNSIVGVYSAADKLIQAVKGLMGPVSQTIYPFISRKVNESAEACLNFIRYILFSVGLVFGLLSLFIFFFADMLILLLLGEQYSESIEILRIMSVLPCLIALSNVFGIQTMVVFSRNKPFTLILVLGSILSFILSFILVPTYQAVGSAYSVVIVETFITLSMFIYIQRNGLKLIGKNKNV